jgi:hypothetical protein
MWEDEHLKKALVGLFHSSHFDNFALISHTLKNGAHRRAAGD